MWVTWYFKILLGIHNVQSEIVLFPTRIYIQFSKCLLIYYLYALYRTQLLDLTFGNVLGILFH